MPPHSKTRRPIGEEADWKRVVNVGNGQMVLLKNDGSLWGWGANDHNWFPLMKLKPRRIGTDSDWSDILVSPLGAFAWKKDGRAWRVAAGYTSTPVHPGVLEFTVERWENFDQFKWRSLTAVGPFALAVCDDGTLWTFFSVQNGGQFFKGERERPTQIGTASNWNSVAGNNRMLVALKADGTLWKWDVQWNFRDNWLEGTSPVRLGTHSDWVALAGSYGAVVSLAGDGTVWQWADRFSSRWLAPSRKAEKFADVFANK